MSGRWESTGGKGRMWVKDGENLYLVTTRQYVPAADAATAIRLGHERADGGHWTATPVGLQMPGQMPLPDAIIQQVTGVHGRVQPDPADSESGQVKGDTDRP